MMIFKNGHSSKTIEHVYIAFGIRIFDLGVQDQSSMSYKQSKFSFKHFGIDIFSNLNIFLGPNVERSLLVNLIVLLSFIIFWNKNNQLMYVPLYFL